MIFLDTSGLVALFDRRDGQHAHAKTAWARLHRSAEALVLTDLILVETITLLRRRAGIDVAIRIADRLRSGSVAEIAHVDAPLLDRGFDVLARYRDKDLSLTDCVSFAFMRQRKIARAFTFDDDFRACGFEAVS